MCSGVWPPSNQPGIPGPVRASWPFVPRPAVLPWPCDVPRPRRRGSLREPRGLATSCWRITHLLLIADMDEVSDAAEHPAKRGRIVVRHHVAGTPQAQRGQRLLRAFLLPDRALVLADLETGHDAASAGRRASRGGRPRVWRTVSAERSCESALIVARTTFTGLVLPSDFERMSLIPADSTTARTDPPAMTPVPFDAGRSTTRAAPKSATTWCGIVRSTSGTSITCFLASSRPLLIAPGTSSALPRPAPT